MREDKYILNELNRFLKSIDSANDVRQVLLSILESVLEISKNQKSLRKLSKDFDIDKRHKYHFIAKDFGVELFMDVDGDTFEILNGFEDYIHSLGKTGREIGMKLIDILRWVEKIYPSIEAVDIKDTRPINDPLNFDWSESTLRLFLNELPTDVKSLNIDLDYVKGFLADLTHDLKDLISSFGKNDSTVKEYKLAIKEMEEYIIKAKALSDIPKWKKGGIKESKSVNEIRGGKKLTRGLFKGFYKLKDKVAIPLQNVSKYNISNHEMVHFGMRLTFAFNKQNDFKLRHDSFIPWIIDNKLVLLFPPKESSRLKINIQELGKFTLKQFISRLRKAAETTLSEKVSESSIKFTDNMGLNESLWSDQYKEAKIVLDELRRYLKSIDYVNDIRQALLSILESGLEDANFHSEVRSLRKQFKIDKTHKYYFLTQDFGRELANDVKWDGTAILLGVEDYIFTSPRAMASKLMDIKRWIGNTFEMNERKGSKPVNETGKSKLMDYAIEKLKPYKKQLEKIGKTYNEPIYKALINRVKRIIDMGGEEKYKRDSIDDILQSARLIIKVNERKGSKSVNETGKSKLYKVGDTIKLKKGIGYWDVTQYPYGGDFQRLPKETTATVVDGMVKYPNREVRATINVNGKTRKIVVSSIGIIESVNEASVNEKMSETQKLSKKARKLVDEINDLIKVALDNDGDPLGVIDKTSTWQDPTYYKPIILNDKTGRLTITYTTYGTKGLQKDIILGRELEDFGLATLRDIRKQYKAGIKFFQKHGYSQ